MPKRRAPRGRTHRRQPGRAVQSRWLWPALGGVALAVVGIGFVALRAGDGPGGGAEVWAMLNTADVHALAFDPADNQHLFFGHHNGLLESVDGGRTWRPTGLSGADAMNVPLTNANRFQIAGHNVYMETTDGGASWQPVPNDLPGLDLHAFTVDPADPDHAWTFAVGFGLFETSDAGRHWQLRQSGNWGALIAYRDGATTELVAVGPEGLVRSSDGGAGWTALAYPGAPLAALAASTDGGVLYAATSAGLKRSTDGGASWSDTGFASPALSVAVASDDPMVVALVDQSTRFYRSPDGGASWPAP